MKGAVIASILVATIQPVSTTFSNAPSYDCPARSNDTCNEKQLKGFDWEDLNLGNFDNFGGFSFSGFSCVSSLVFGSNVGLDRRTTQFQSKCIAGSASQESSQALKISSVGSAINKFSIESIELSVEFSSELEFHYLMADGSTCRQRSLCSASGTTVKNTQCGGANEVSIILPSPPIGRATCSVGIHSIKFHCASTTITRSSYPTTTLGESSVLSSVNLSTNTLISSMVKQSTTVPSATVILTNDTAVLSRHETSYNTSHVSKSTSSLLLVLSGPNDDRTTSKMPTYQSYRNLSTSQIFTSNSMSMTLVSSSTALVTRTALITTTVCPLFVAECPKSEEITITTLTESVSTTTCMLPGRPDSTISLDLATKSSSSSIPPPSIHPSPIIYPEVLPSCMNTWLSVTYCHSNTNASCYCTSAQFIEVVFECLLARSGGMTELFVAQAYLQGICAPYVTQNPAIVTAIVSNQITNTALPGATLYGPLTTIIIQTSLIEAYTDSNGIVAPSSSTTATIFTTVTVPQLSFATLSYQSTIDTVLIPIASPATTVLDISGTASYTVSSTTTVAPLTATSGQNVFSSPMKTNLANSANKEIGGVIILGAVAAPVILVL